MNLTIFLVPGVLSIPNLFLVDSAVKGTALLIAAGIATFILRRDSAATRHLVWLLAIVAMLGVPALSAVLPHWRALPEWASISQKPAAVEISQAPVARSTNDAIASDWHVNLENDVQPAAIAIQPVIKLSNSLAAPIAPDAIRTSVPWNWQSALLFVWGVGFGILLLRLLAARWMLRNAERQGTVIGMSGVPAGTRDDSIVIALQAAALQLRISRPVILLIHPDKSIPLVWGILK
ncbi:MAG: peptidase BlaR1, partial [Planctomycetaceae bacterium]|nr:peptidase BlaR1 [Planctomycetaceae bacterium]